jgi:transcriptional regulator with XRE-family HTH domain
MIGERLCDLRKDRGMTQQQLADVLHLTKHNISAYERDYNEAPDDVKIAIAKYFHVSVDYLLGLTNRPNQYESPGSRLPANKKLPEDVQHIIKTLIRLISMATAANPDLVVQEITSQMECIRALREEEQKEDTSNPDT